MKRPLAIYGLIVVFAANLVQGIHLLVTYDFSISIAIFDFYGYEAIFQVVLALILFLDGISVYFLLAPKPIGLVIVMGDMALSIGLNIWTFFLGLGQLSVIRDAFIESRQARGLNTHEDKLDAMFAPDSWMFMYLGYLAFELFVVILLIVKRGYFRANR